MMFVDYFSQSPLEQSMQSEGEVEAEEETEGLRGKGRMFRLC